MLIHTVPYHYLHGWVALFSFPLMHSCLIRWGLISARVWGWVELKLALVRCLIW
jgi:hypothetical protein